MSDPDWTSGATSTVPHRAIGVPVKTLRVEIIEGPDKGKAGVESDTISIGTAEGNTLVLTDATVSRFHVELARASDGFMVTDPGSKNGVRVGAVQIDRGKVAANTVLELGATKIRVSDGKKISVELHGEEELGEIRGRAPVMRRLMAQVERVAKSDAPVFLSGESGTGKELVARALHTCSPRSKKPFVTVDCGSLSPNLVASELFGHERGAFTGADRQRIGAFEEADGGTIFLDEIGELPPALQASLLGVLERRTFRRLGGSQDISVDVRLVSATHRDLRAEVNAGRFRLDLYYRMAIVALKIPSLRERVEDIPLLIAHFLRECGCEESLERYFSSETMTQLEQHSWPGNVRELRNLVEATVATGEPPPLEQAVVSPAGATPRTPVAQRATTIPAGMSYKDARNQVLADFERRFLEELLDRTAGNISRAAREASMDRSYLLELLKRHKLRE